MKYSCQFCPRVLKPRIISVKKRNCLALVCPDCEAIFFENLRRHNHLVSWSGDRLIVDWTFYRDSSRIGCSPYGELIPERQAEMLRILLSLRILSFERKNHYNLFWPPSTSVNPWLDDSMLFFRRQEDARIYMKVFDVNESVIISRD